MIEITFAQIARALEDFYLPQYQLVVGIANGGIVPAVLVAQKIGCDLKIVHFNYRNLKNIPRYFRPRLLSKVDLPKTVKKILVVDDAAITGKTLIAAKKLLKKYKVKTMVFKGRADYVLFPDIANCVKWPWQAK